MSLNAAFPVGLAVDWRRPASVNIGDTHLTNWLLDKGSLTERIQSMCQQFSLTLLGQTTLLPHDNELSLLRANGQISYQVREILLCNNEQPWVFARSVIPQAVVDTELSNLGREPLGRRLFNDTRFTRSPFEIGTLNASQLGYANNQTLWGRRSVFTLNNHSMIVAEVFLPQFPAYSHCDSREMSL